MFLTRGHVYRLDVDVPLCLISVYQTKTLIYFARAIAPEFDHPDNSDVYYNINTIAWMLSARIASPHKKKDIHVHFVNATVIFIFKSFHDCEIKQRIN